MAWFIRSKENIKENVQREMPDGLWTKCPSCSEVIFKNELEANLFCCTKCGHHFRIGSSEYIRIILDENSFVETNTEIKSVDSLHFTDSKPYSQRLETSYSSTNVNDALTTGHGTINGRKVSFSCMNFNFIGGSMGSVVGEKSTGQQNMLLIRKYLLFLCQPPAEPECRKRHCH
jgi:acetyl-CoA carboxylase carboxyl transferase subunit beta